MGEVGRQVAQQREGQAVGVPFVAVDVAVAMPAAEVQAHEMAGIGGVAGQCLVDAERHFAVVEAAMADTAVDGLLVAAGQFGDVVDRAAHRARTMQERRWPADQFDAVEHPGIHWPRGAAVAQVDAVVQLGNLVLGEAAVGHEAAKAGVGRGVDAGHGVDHVLAVLGAALLDQAAVRDTDRGRRFPRGEAQARAGADRLVQLHAAGGVAFTVNGGGAQFHRGSIRPGKVAGAHEEHQGGIAKHVGVSSTQRSWLTASARSQARPAEVRRNEVRLRGKRRGRRGG